MEDLYLTCGEAPQNKAAMRMLTVLSVFASLFIHISAVAFGAIISAFVAGSPVSSLQGEPIQVELVTLRTAGSDPLPDTSALPAKDAGSPSTPRRTNKRKPADVANGESKQRTEHAAQSGAAKNEEGAHTASGYGNEASPLGTHANPRPEYPEMARQRGQEGKTVLLVDVNSQGAPAEIQILKSSGYLLLDKAAITTVWRWKFIPARKGGLPVPGQVVLPVEFCLR